MQVFFAPEDYALYLEILEQQASRNRVTFWAYCQMPNHVHLVAVPESQAGLARALGEAHRRYAESTNRRHGWRGHLWQERFWSFAADERAVLAVARYVLLNPVRAGLVERAEAWPYSSAAAHLGLRAPALIDPEPLARRIGDWRSWLEREAGGTEAEQVRRHTASGRPLGEEPFLAAAERRLGRRLRPREPGRPCHREGLEEARRSGWNP